MEDEIKRREAKTKKRAELESKLAKLKEDERLEATLKEKLEKTKERKHLISRLDAKLRDAASLDICFALDCTGSMGSHIRAMQENIRKVVSDIQECYCDTPLRLSFIGYRDHGDGENRLAVHPFSMDVEAFKTKVASQSATGGQDGPEDIHGALNVANQLEWKSATRILYHIADAPCHGREFHDMSDDYPGGDKYGLKIEDLLNGLNQKNVIYYFGKINSSTDKMIGEFNKRMGVFGKPKFIDMVSCTDASKMMESVSHSVTETYTSSISTSASTTSKIDGSHIVTSSDEPSWSRMLPETVVTYEMKKFLSPEDLINNPDDGTMCVSTTPVTLRVKVGKLPFAKGSCRAAYKAQQVSDSGKVTPVVHKLSMSTKPKHLTRESYVTNSISTHCAADCMATEFAKVKPSRAPSIRFIKVDLVQYLERPGAPFCTQEALLAAGTWVKYNNNSGMVLRKDGSAPHDVIQTFSHWTYHRTGGELMIVDCQGVYNAGDSSFVLTDPAVHCQDILRFGGTNLGKEGFKRFFKSHKCNAYCAELGLSMPTIA